MSSEELTDFFNWRPASLYASSTASQSKGTRDPSFYDKLLAENFILRRVRNLPSLPKDIEGTVDNALDVLSQHKIKLPPYSKMFPTEDFRSHILQTRPAAMKNELSVAEFYAHTTAVFCVNVASVLALQPMFPSFPAWLNVLCWTVTPSESGYAVADGSLQIIPMDSPESEAYRLLYKSDVWHHLQQVRKAFGDLAIWEFKSLSVGDHPTMVGIRSEAFTGIPFRWETMNNGERETVRRRYEPPPIGPDARVTPWELPLDSNENSNSSSEQGHGQSALQAFPGEAFTEIQAEQHPVSPIRFSSSSLWSVPSAHDKSEAAEQGHGQIIQPSQGKPSAATQITGTRGRRAKSRGRGRGEPRGLPTGSKRKRDDDDGNYQSKQELTAASFIQQAWARAVRHDATLIIIQSGNSEYVCVRHRATQTLYVSDLIDVPNYPGYAKLHTGIYLTALLDAMQRVAPMDGNVDPSSNIGGASEDNGNDVGHDCHRKDPKQGCSRDPGSRPGFSARHQTNDGPKDDLKIDQLNRKDPDRCEDELVKQIITECDKRNGLLMHFQYGVYDSPVPAAFIRRAVGPMPTPASSPQHRRVFQASERLMLVITSEIGTGATGIAHGGTLEVELPDQPVSLDVVAKLAFSDHQKERLAHEHTIYCYLSSRHIMGIPTLLGYFSSIDGGPSALLMTHRGVSVSSNTPLSSATRQEFLMILQEIHKVGILHYDIRCQNLLVDKWGHASIIDFDQAKKSSSAKAMEEELHYLVDLLNS